MTAQTTATTATKATTRAPTVCLTPADPTSAHTVQLMGIGRGGTLLLGQAVSPDRPKPYRLADVTLVPDAIDQNMSPLLKTGRIFRAFFVGSKDRYGRRAVHLVGDGTRWVQADMLAAGRAFALPRPGVSASCRAALRAMEQDGERNTRGVWSGSSPVLPASDLARLYEQRGAFVLVEGKVLSVGDRARRVYLNFGETWSEDFTVSLAKSGRGAFNGDLTRLLAAKGKTLRVRGVLDWSGGPLIRVMDEGQIEFVEP